MNFRGRRLNVELRTSLYLFYIRISTLFTPWFLDLYQIEIYNMFKSLLLHLRESDLNRRDGEIHLCSYSTGLSTLDLRGVDGRRTEKHLTEG